MNETQILKTVNWC